MPTDMPQGQTGKYGEKSSGREAVLAVCGKRPFDLLLENVRIVNVFSGEITPGQAGLTGDRIAYIGPPEEALSARRVIDGGGNYLLPGFVDSHMHLESSMLTPDRFARVALSHGTTTVMADPHEIGNVCGLAGIRYLAKACAAVPLRALVMAPSTIPSSPGYEYSGFAADAENIAEMLDDPAITGLGEVMDFHAVAEGDPHMLGIIAEAEKRGRIIDGHASLLTGKGLKAFRASGIDSDHTLGTAEKLREELTLGFTCQVQESMLNEDIVRAMNEARFTDRICLCTDDVPLPRLMRDGHLNHVYKKAVGLGLDPMLAVRFTTINPAVRCRLYDLGGVAPGMRADLQLVSDLRAPEPLLVIASGEVISENGVFLKKLYHTEPDEALLRTMHLESVSEEDLRIRAEVPAGFPGGKAAANVIVTDGTGVRTKHETRSVVLSPESGGKALADPGDLLKMAVFNRHGRGGRGLALIAGMPKVRGAAALTYGHDCHNLTVFGGNDRDMALAANAVIRMGGGIAAAADGKLLTKIPLPVAGLLSLKEPEELLSDMERFLSECAAMGFAHKNLLSFFTCMPLAVSPEIKCTDLGLLDVKNKCFLPLIELPEKEEN